MQHLFQLLRKLLQLKFISISILIAYENSNKLRHHSEHNVCWEYKLTVQQNVSYTNKNLTKKRKFSKENLNKSVATFHFFCHILWTRQLACESKEQFVERHLAVYQINNNNFNNCGTLVVLLVPHRIKNLQTAGPRSPLQLGTLPLHTGREALRQVSSASPCRW